MSNDPKTPRGFARMDPARHREICQRGGDSSRRRRAGHRWTSGAEAARAGRTGGLASARVRAERRRAADPQLQLALPQPAAA